MNTVSTSEIGVDLTAIGHKAMRSRLLTLLRKHYSVIREEVDFWPAFMNQTAAHKRGHILVLCDLSVVIRHFQKDGPHHWCSSVRNLQPYFVGFVRTKLDREYTEWIDDLVKASDLRLNVCNDASNWGTIAHCLHAAISALQPDVVLNVHYLADQDRIWIKFGDGLTGAVGWTELGMQTIRPNIIPESATTSPLGSAVEMIMTDGSVFDLDAAAIRAVLDTRHRDRLSHEAGTHRDALGRRLRGIRTGKGLNQTELGQLAGLDQAVISRLERGKVRPRIDTVHRLASALQVAPSDLFGG